MREVTGLAVLEIDVSDGGRSDRTRARIQAFTELL
jgi:hypothetical protein